MLRGELRGRDAADGAVRADLVVVAAPGADEAASLRQGLEPVLVEALVAELAVEALEKGAARDGLQRMLSFATWTSRFRSGWR